MRKLLVRFFVAALCLVALAAMSAVSQPFGLVDDENGRSETQTDAAPPVGDDIPVPKEPIRFAPPVPDTSNDFGGGSNHEENDAATDAEPAKYVAPIPAEEESAEESSTEAPAEEEPAIEPVSVNRYSDVVPTITDDERDMLVRLVYHESRGIGGEYVMEVVLNRMLDDEFPSDVSDVVYQRNQFSPASGLYSYPINEPDAFALCQEIVETVLSPDYQPELPSYYLYFNSIGPNSEDYVWKGGNVFYGYA